LGVVARFKADARCGTTFAKDLAEVLMELKMNEQEFQTKLAELMGEISTLPASERAKLEQLADETRQRHERLRQTVSSLQESLDYLRLSIKYLVFDLEATRRENGYLRKMLEETSGNSD
jgi:chromosome segregation ATPase